MMACLSPADYDKNDTLSTLSYARLACKIKNKPTINYFNNIVARLDEASASSSSSLESGKKFSVYYLRSVKFCKTFCTIVFR